MIFIKRVINATFESNDAAELALLTLTRGNIPVLSSRTVKAGDFTREPDFFRMAPIYSTHRSDTAASGITPLPILNMQQNPTAAHLFDDVVSADVMLEIEVPVSYSNRARRMLTSLHAYNLTEHM